MDYRRALELAAAADHARAQAELARAAVPRVEEKLQRLQAAVAATEEALTEARRAADEAEQVANRAATDAAAHLPRREDVPAVSDRENVTVIAKSAGSAGTAHQES